MPTLRIGCPLEGDFSGLAWSSMTVFDARRLVLSLVVGSFLAMICALVWHFLEVRSLPLGSVSGEEFFWACVALIFVHEVSHLLGFPHAGLDANAVMGIWPQIGSPYVQYLLPMKRSRFLIVLVLPILTLSIFPMVLVYAGVGPIAYLSWVSVLNCLGAGSDIYILGKLLSTVPANASVLESSGNLYWTQQSSLSIESRTALTT